MSKLLLFVIILSVIILGSYLNYPIEKLTTQGDNGVNYDNYDQCIENAKKQQCSSLNTDKDVITQTCNPNWLVKRYILDVKCDDLSKDQCYVKKLKRLCLNNYQDDPRGFGCKSDNYGETGYEPDRKLGCAKPGGRPGERPDRNSNRRPGRNSNRLPDYNKPDCDKLRISQDQCNVRSEQSINSWKKKGISIFETQNKKDYNEWLKEKPADCNKFDLFNKNKTEKCSEWENNGISIFKSKKHKDWLDIKPTKCSIFKKIGGPPCGCCEGCKWSDSKNICVEDY